MKKFVRVFPILILLLLNFFTIIITDMQEKEKYSKFPSYDQTIGFNMPENAKDEQIQQVYNSAKKHNVLMVKTTYNEDTKATEEYIATENIFNLLSTQLHMNKNNERDANKKWIATYRTSDSTSYYVSDFLNNDRYAFYSVEELQRKHLYKSGLYSLYYQNDTAYNEFLNQATTILQESQDTLLDDSYGILGEHTDIILSAMFISIAFFILFYFILILFLLYRQSKKIGVLLLLGYSKKSILNVMNKKYLMFSSIFTIVCCIGCYIGLPNAKIELFIRLMIMDCFMIGLTIVISYIALFFICKYTNLSNILKKQSIVQKISNVCLLAKFVMVIGLILFAFCMLPFIQETIHTKDALADSQILMNYAVFASINDDNAEVNDNQRYLKLYKEVVEKKIDHIYVMFGEYLETDSEMIKDYVEQEKEGERYRIASVDINYLNTYDDVTYYDNLHNKVDLESIDQEFYLIPQSKKGYTKPFIEKIQKRYANLKLTIPVLLYYYDDHNFHTYDSKNGVPTFASPIFRVIHKDNPYTYLENSYGIDVAGTGLITGLKFNISKNKDLYQRKLLECVKNAGLQNVLLENNLISYQNYYADVITNVNKANAIFLGGCFIGLLIYITLVTQTFILFIEARKNEVLVKSIIGFSRKDIFLKVIAWNLGATILPISGLFTYALVSNSFDLTMLIAICVVLIVIESLLLLLITRVIKMNNIFTQIKGE